MALRILREAKMNLINVAVTQGSKNERQAERLAELRNACNYLGYGLQTTAPNGLEKVTARTRQSEPQLWADMVKVVADILAKHSPRVILFPHERDWNGTHIGVHYLVVDALRQMPRALPVTRSKLNSGARWTIRISWWVSARTWRSHHRDDLSCRRGETQPIHLLLPAWMMDNVRRGAELVGGQGAAQPGLHVCRALPSAQMVARPRHERADWRKVRLKWKTQLRFSCEAQFHA
jgi:hypothetical protein